MDVLFGFDHPWGRGVGRSGEDDVVCGCEGFEAFDVGMMGVQ